MPSTTSSRGAEGAAGPPRAHAVEVPQRRADDVRLLAAVDRPRAAEELLELADQELVGVGGAGDLPEPEVRRVRLPRGQVAQPPGQVGLGLHQDHRHVEVVADRHRVVVAEVREVQRPARLAQRHRRAAAGVDQEAVEDPVERLHAVDVGGQRVRRLRLPHREPAGDVDVGQRPGQDARRRPR